MPDNRGIKRFRSALMKTVARRRRAVHASLILRKLPVNGSRVSISGHELVSCPRCGTAWRVKSGLCVGCLLSCGLDAEMYDGQTLNEVLDLVDIRDVE